MQAGRWNRLLTSFRDCPDAPTSTTSRVFLGIIRISLMPCSRWTSLGPTSTSRYTPSTTRNFRIQRLSPFSSSFSPSQTTRASSHIWTGPTTNFRLCSCDIMAQKQATLGYVKPAQQTLGCGSRRSEIYKDLIN